LFGLAMLAGLFAIFVTQNNGGGAMYYTLKDHQGSLRASTSASSQTAKAASYCSGFSL